MLGRGLWKPESGGGVCFISHVLVLFFGWLVGTPGFDSRFRRGAFCRVSRTDDFNIGTEVAALPGAWCYGVSTRIDWPDVSKL